MSITTLERKLNCQKNRMGLTLGRLRLQESCDVQEPIGAHINPADWGIEITIKKGYNPVRDELTKLYVEKKKIGDPLEKICADVTFHEVGHWELPRGSGYGCPHNIPMHDKLLEAVNEELKVLGKEASAAYVTNVFEDVLNNLNCRLHTDHAGQALFWNEQGLSKGNFGKFYEAFVRLNLSLWGGVDEHNLLKRFYTIDQTVIEAVRTIRNEWQVPSYNRPRDEAVIRARTGYCFDKDKWIGFAKTFARAMAPLLEERQQHQMFGAGTCQPQPGDGSKDRSSKGQSAADKKLGTKEGKEQAAKTRYNAGDGPATNRDSYEQYDALYKSLAKEIRIETETISHAHTLPLIPYGREEFDPEQHDPLKNRISLGLTENGNVGLAVNQGWIEHKEHYKRNLRRFPKLVMITVDTSGSMKHAPGCAMTEGEECDKAGSRIFLPWGDNSKLHHAYVGTYGIDLFLQRQHIAPYIDSVIGNFSRHTIIGQGNTRTKTLLTPQFGGTDLDLDKISPLLQDETVYISLSDGEIQGWHQKREAYQKLITAKHIHAAHIHIGNPNEFSQDLETWGIPVSYVMGGDDLTKTMIKTAKNQYQKHWRNLQ